MEKTVSLKLDKTEITFCDWGTPKIEVEICNDGAVDYQFIDRQNVMEFINDLNKWVEANN